MSGGVTYVLNEKHTIIDKEVVSLSKATSVIFRPPMPEREDPGTIKARHYYHHMHTKHACDIYECVEWEVLQSTNKCILWIEGICDKNSSFVGMTPTYSDKFATTRKASTV